MSGLPCPVCGSVESDVYDSRPASSPVPSIQRRRECAKGHRYKTVEIIADTPLGSLVDLSVLPDRYRAEFRALYRALRSLQNG